MRFMVQWRGRCLCDIKILWPEQVEEPDEGPGAEATTTLADDDPPAFGFVR